MPHAISVDPGLDVHPLKQAVEIMIAGRERLAEALDGTPTKEESNSEAADDLAIREKLISILDMAQRLPKTPRVANSVVEGEAFHLLMHVLQPVTAGLPNTPVTRANDAVALYLAHLILKDLEES